MCRSVLKYNGGATPKTVFTILMLSLFSVDLHGTTMLCPNCFFRLPLHGHFANAFPLFYIIVCCPYFTYGKYLTKHGPKYALFG